MAEPRGRGWVAPIHMRPGPVSRVAAVGIRRGAAGPDSKGQHQKKGGEGMTSSAMPLATVRFGPWNGLLDLYLKSFVKKGRLGVTWPDGHRTEYGEPSAPVFNVQFRDPDLARRLILSPELAVGEAYVEGVLDLEHDDLHGFFDLMLRN